MYPPPFTISSKTVNLIAEISSLIERYANRLEQNDALLLCKANRIKTIHSSLAIEVNKLSEGEVRNAIITDDLYSSINPFKEDDLLRAHGTMMVSITEDAGKFRHTSVSVYYEQGKVHDVGIKSSILDIIVINPQISAKAMASILNISLRQCERPISDLKSYSCLKRIGLNKTGH
jgi:Fic family protein